MLITVWAAMTWLPTIVANTTAASATLDVRGITMMLFGTGGIVGSLVSGFVVMRLRYRRSLLICYGGAALFLAILLLSPQSSLTLTLILVAVLSVFFGMSQAIMSSYIPFLFPHSVRYRYTGVSFNAGRVVTAISVANLGIIVPSVGGLEIALCLYTIPLLIGMAVTLRTPEPEYS
jgi:predicted MFS family arabinose efflux permease